MLPPFRRTASFLTVIRVALFAALVALPSSTAPAQAPTAPATAAARGDTITEVRLRDGSVLFGRIVEQTPERVVLVTLAGARVELQRTQIESMRLTSGRAVGDAFWAEDPNATRLFFTSTARPLRKGSGYIASFELFLPLVAYGVTDRFTIAGGTPIIPESFGRLWYFAPKYTVSHREKSAVAVGALAFVLPEDVVDEGSLGIIYANGTWGSRDRAVTAGAGWGYRWASGASDVSNNPVVMLGFESRLSRRVKFVTENWIITGSNSDAFISGGLRFIGDRISADLGVGGLAGTGTGCCIPLVNFVYNFGRR